MKKGEVQYKYLIRRDSLNQFTITKWDDGVLPVAEYRFIIKENGKTECNCPSGHHRGVCHHKQMVRWWLEANEPESFIEKAFT